MDNENEAPKEYKDENLDCSGMRASDISPLTNDPNGNPDAMMLEFAALKARLGEVELLLCRFFNSHHRTEGYTNAAGDLNIGLD